MRSLKCRRCNTVLSWDETSFIIRCPVCGTQYRMKARGQTQASVDGVDAIPTTQGQYAGAALVKSFIPQGWRTATNAPEQECNLLAPLTPQVEYTAPNNQVCITFTGARAYNHLDPTPQNMQMQGRISMPGRMIGLAYRDAGTICDGLVQGNQNLTDPRLLSEMNSPDTWAADQIQKFTAEYQQSGTLNPGGNWAKKYYTARLTNGQTIHKLVEALVTYAYLPVTPQEQQMYQLLLRTSIRGISRQVPPPQPKLRWVVNYVLETSAVEQQFSTAMQYHDKIRNSFEYLPLFTQETNRIREMLTLQSIQETNEMNDAMAQMNRDNMASWDRRRNIVQGASDYGTQVMRDMRESTARTNDRVNNLRSEAIRGVNTYYTHNTGYGEPRVVEASTQWDHVYQNQRHPDCYAAKQGDAPLEFGVDFEELDRTNGDY